MCSLQFSDQCLLCRNSHVMAYSCLVLKDQGSLLFSMDQFWVNFLPLGECGGVVPQSEHKNRGQSVDSGHRAATLQLCITLQASHSLWASLFSSVEQYQLVVFSSVTVVPYFPANLLRVFIKKLNVTFINEDTFNNKALYKCKMLLSVNSMKLFQCSHQRNNI